MEAGLDDDTEDNTVTTVTQAAALTTTAGDATPLGITAISDEVAAAINQLAANQSAIMSQMAATNAQMAALSVVPPQAQHMRAFALREQFHVPPIQQVAVPMQQPFLAVGAYPSGGGGQRTGHDRGCGRGGRRGGCSHTPFADAMHGAGTAQPIAAMVPYGGGITQPHTGVQQQQCRNPDFSNIYKVHNNWNVCFSCGFDIENVHMSITSPFKRWNHQDSFTCKNAQQFIAAGYDPCTKGMHKTVLPSGRNT